MVEIEISKIYMEKQKHMQITKKFWSTKLEGDVENT